MICMTAGNRKAGKRSQIWLLALAFISGFAVMVVEVCGARLLAPYLGDTLFSWTSSIAVVLAALGIGYMAGGALADRRTDARHLSAVAVLGGLSILLMLLISTPVLEYGASFGLEYGPLVASVLLFALPNVFLGMVTPYAVRLRSCAVGRVGEDVGIVYSVATAGSITGALSSGYILIPYVGIMQSFFLSGVALMLAGLALSLGRRYLALVVVAVLAYQFVPNFTVHYSGARVLYQADTPYYHLGVVNSSGVLELITNLDIQSLAPSQGAPGTYYGYQGIVYRQTGVENALYLGLGGGEMVDELYYSTNASIDVVEIDPSVIWAAKTYFGLPNSSRIRVYNEDGRFFLRNSNRTYGMIVMDAYGGSYQIPYQLLTLQAFQEMKAHLTANGSLLINLVSPAAGGNASVFKSVYRTLGLVFPDVYVFPLNPNLMALQNIVIIANSDNWTSQGLGAALNESIGRNLSYEMALEQHFNKTSVNASAYPVLTDNVDPYDIYIAQALAGYGR